MFGENTQLRITFRLIRIVAFIKIIKIWFFVII